MAKYNRTKISKKDKRRSNDRKTKKGGSCTGAADNALNVYGSGDLQHRAVENDNFIALARVSGGGTIENAVALSGVTAATAEVPVKGLSVLPEKIVTVGGAPLYELSPALLDGASNEPLNVYSGGSGAVLPPFVTGNYGGNLPTAFLMLKPKRSKRKSSQATKKNKRRGNKK